MRGSFQPALMAARRRVIPTDERVKGWSGLKLVSLPSGPSASSLKLGVKYTAELESGPVLRTHVSLGVPGQTYRDATQAGQLHALRISRRRTGTRARDDLCS